MLFFKLNTSYDLEDKMPIRTCDEIVHSLSDKEFDIIYISQSYENFIDQEKGLELCEKVYSCYKKDMFIITRSFLKDETIHRLKKMNADMKQNENQLFVATSLCADESYLLSENPEKCPTPDMRLSNLQRVYQSGIKTILMLRPIFPNNIVPTKEYVNIVKRAKEYVGAVVSSGLIGTERILAELKIDKNHIKVLEHGDFEYLDNIDRDRIVYLDVEKELKEIEPHCLEIGIPFLDIVCQH